MNISGLIQELEAIKQQHGDLRIVKRVDFAPIGAVRDVNKLEARVTVLKVRSARERYDKIALDGDALSDVKVMVL